MDDIIVEIPGIGDVAFPASMSRDEITKQVRRLSSQQTGMIYEEAPGISISYPSEETPERNLVEEAGRQVGLTARAGVTGAAGLGTMVGDPLNQLINMIAGTNLPSASESLQNLMTMAGLPQPENAQERVVQDVASAVGGVTALPKLVQGATKVAPRLEQAFAPITQQLRTQAVSGGLAAGGAGAAREADLGPVGQTAIGLTAGMLPFAKPIATGTVRQMAESVAKRSPTTRAVVTGLTEPFTEAGQQRMAGRLLRQQATDPDAAIRSMEQAVPQVPGSQPMMAAASKDYGLASLERSLSQFPEAAGEYAKRQAQNNAARNILMEKYTADNVLTDAIAKRKAITDPLIKQTFAAKTPVKINSVIEEIDTILKSPAGAKKIIQDELGDYKYRLQQEINENGFADPERLYSIRQEINDTLDGLTVGSRAENAKKLASKELIRVRNVLDNVITSGAPEYPEYMRMYRTMSRPIDQVKEMENISTKASGGTVDPTTGYRTYTPVRFSKLVEQLTKDPRNPLSKTQMGVLKKVAKELDDGAIVNLPGIKPAGSDTFKNLTVANLLGNISANPNARNIVANVINNFARPISWIYNGGEEAVRQLLIDAMLDPKIAAQLMRKATEQNIQKVSQSLSQKAAQMGYGATFGINVAQ